ncbi:hypothetical protein O0L34_g9325 [Tuta absoluta]|nr:hypothetical protein O0L34_g9325 [Tuta absoluta]
MTSKVRRKNSYGVKTRTIIARVSQFLKEEYEFMKATNYDHCDLTLLSQVRRRTADAVGVSPITVAKILNEEHKKYEFEFTREKPRQEPSKRKVDMLAKLDSHELSPYILRKVIYNYIATEKTTPPVEKVRKILKSVYGFCVNRGTLRDLLSNIGITLYKTDFSRKVLAEKHLFKFQRFKYLKQIQQYRLENRPIVYTASNVVYKTSDDTRYTAVFAGTEHGFLPNSYLILKDHNMTPEIYDEWITNKLLPNLPKKSVVVIGHENYNNQLLNVPTAFSRREEIVAWLEKYQIPFDSKLHKIELYDFFRKNKDKFIVYKTDRHINDAGFTVLRIPTKHPELNPIVSILDSIKTVMKSYQDTDYIENIIKIEMDNISSNANTWTKTFENVKGIEEIYLTYFENEVSFNYNLHDDDDDYESEYAEEERKSESDKEDN